MPHVITLKPARPVPWAARGVRRPLAFWMLDEKSTNRSPATARDWVGGLHGVYDGAVGTVGRYGDSGWEMTFNRAFDQRVDLTNTSRLDLTGSVTIATSYRLATAPPINSAFQIYARDNSSGGRGVVLDIANNSVANAYRGLEFYFNGGSVPGNVGGGTVNHISEAVNPVAGQDRLAVCSYRKSDGRFSMWYDGNLVRRFNGTTAGSPTATASSMIGRRVYPSFTGPFDGVIRFVALWDAELSDGEVRRVLLDPFAEFRPRRASVVAPRPAAAVYHAGAALSLDSGGPAYYAF